MTDENGHTYTLKIHNNDLIIIAAALIGLATKEPEIEDVVIEAIDRLAEQTEAENLEVYGSTHPWGENNAYDALFGDDNEDDIADVTFHEAG